MRREYSMSADKGVLLPPPPLVLAPGDVPRFSDQLKIHRPNDDSASRMYDDGCPNENPSVEDATGYSNEDEASRIPLVDEIQNGVGD
jgi:hypothetical protein